MKIETQEYVDFELASDQFGARVVVEIVKDISLNIFPPKKDYSLITDETVILFKILDVYVEFIQWPDNTQTINIINSRKCENFQPNILQEICKVLWFEKINKKAKSRILPSSRCSHQ